MSKANFGRCTSISVDELTSRPISSNASFFAHRLPGAGLRLTPEEWALIVGALGAYQQALLHKASDVRGPPFPRRIHPTVSVTGMPSAV